LEIHAEAGLYWIDHGSFAASRLKALGFQLVVARMYPGEVLIRSLLVAVSHRLLCMLVMRTCLRGATYHTRTVGFRSVNSNEALTKLSTIVSGLLFGGQATTFGKLSSIDAQTPPPQLLHA
jgi:hypothetical protein